MNLVTRASKPSGLPLLAVERGTVASVLRVVDHTSYHRQRHIMRLAGCWLLLLGAISLHWTTTKGEGTAAGTGEGK